MSKERKNIVLAIEEADEKLSSFLKVRLSMEDYHEAVELSNIVTDLTIHAFGLAVDANREALGLKIDQGTLPELGTGEERD